MEDPAVYKEVWSEFLDHLSETTGKKVQFFPVQSNAAQIEAMRAGRLHIAGFKAPSAILKADYNMVPGEDFEPVFSGKHDNSILGVANQDYKAAAIANSVLNRMISRDVVSEDQIVSLYKSQTFPTTSYGIAHNLKPELQEKIQDAFFSFDWEGTALEEEFSKSGEAQFVPITFKNHWEVIRKIDDANGVAYNCQ